MNITYRSGGKMSEQRNIYRHEVKYYIGKREALQLSMLLKTNMSIDKNANDAGNYWIRSLYFDTIDNKDYYEKIIGFNVRKKIRLRVYDISSDTLKLEIKNKYNQYTHKESITISRQDAISLIDGNSTPLLNYNESTSNKVFGYMHHDLYLPKVIIDYEREAFLYPFENIRVTIDKNVRAAFGNNDMFTDKIGMVSIFSDDVVVLEIKYDKIIPVFLQKALSNFSTQGSQISKYSLGRNILKR